MARAGFVVGGLLIMLFLGWIPIIGWFLFLPVGLVLFIYGLVAHSELEKAALTRPPVVVTQPPVNQAELPLPAKGKYCGNCGRFNPIDAGFCSSCGRALKPE